VRVELGKAQGIMPASEQIQGERYYPGQRLKFFLKDVEKGFRGPQLIVSRGNKEFVEQLFPAEVPEMDNDAVEIKEIAREAGVRSKIAVSVMFRALTLSVRLSAATVRALTPFVTKSATKK
jgi:N utilization substance protein A